MRSDSRRLAFSTTTAAVLSGLIALAAADTAQAQGRPGKPPSAAAAKPGDKAPAKAKGPPMTEKQKKDAAKKTYGQAKEKFEAGDYAAALALYEQADEIIPGVRPKYQVARCLDKLGRAKEAVAGYQRFLGSSPDAEKFKAEVGDAKVRIEALKRSPAKVKVVTDPPSPPNLSFTVDGAPQRGPELSVPPGRHEIIAYADGFESYTQVVVVSFGEQKELSLSLTKGSRGTVAAAPAPVPTATTAPPPPRQPPPGPPSPPKKGGKSNLPAYVAFGVGGVGAIIGTAFGAMALGAKSDFNKNPTTEGADKTQSLALGSDIGWIVMLAGGVTGTVLLVLNRGGDKAAPEAAPPPKSAFRPVVTPFVGPTMGGAAASFQF